MRWLRSTWRLRAVTLLLVTSLLPMAVVWPKQAASRTPAKTHADWLRTQVSAEMDDADRAAFEEALRTAMETDARSLRDFLHHFIAAYVQRAEGPSLAQLFGVTAGAHGQIIDELQRRLAQVSGWAAVPRVSMALHAASSSSSHRSPSEGAVLPAPHVFIALQAVSVRCCSRVLGSALIRTLSVSQPRAP